MIDKVFALKKKIAAFGGNVFEIDYTWDTMEVPPLNKNSPHIINGPARITQTVNGISSTTTHEYDSEGRLIKTISPDQKQTEYTYRCGKSSHVKSLTINRLILNDQGNEDVIRSSIHFKPFLPFNCKYEHNITRLSNDSEFVEQFQNAYSSRNITAIQALVDDIKDRYSADDVPTINHIPYLVGEISLTHGEKETLIKRYTYNVLNGNLMQEMDGHGRQVSYWHNFCETNSEQCQDLSDDQRNALNQMYLTTILEHPITETFNTADYQRTALRALESFAAQTSPISTDALKNILSEFSNVNISGKQYIWNKYTDTPIVEANTNLNKMRYYRNKDNELTRIEYPLNSSYLYRENKLAQFDNVNESTTFFHDGIRNIAYSIKKELDGLGYITREVDPDGSSKQFFYGLNKKVNRIVDSLGRTEQYVYDGLDRIVNVDYPGGEKIHFEYTKQGISDIISVQSQGKTFINYHVSPDGKIIQIDQNKCSDNISEDCMVSHHYQYDEFNHLIHSDGPRGLKINNSYDDLLRFKRHSNVDNSYFEFTNFLSDQSALPTAMQIGVGENVHNFSLIRDAYKRLISISHAESSEPFMEMKYSLSDESNAMNSHFYNSDHPAIINDQSGSSTYFYDGNGDIIGAKRIINAISTDISYDFFVINDAFGNPYQLKYPNIDRASLTNLPENHPIPISPEIVYNTDDSGKLQSVLSKVDNTVLATYQYDSAGQLIKTSYPNGVITSYVYHMSGRVKKINISKDESILFEEDYEYDSYGNAIKIAYYDGSYTENTYDLAGQLINSKFFSAQNETADFTQNYSFDAGGNLTQYSDNYQNIEYIMSTESNRIERINYSEKVYVHYEYDAYGHLKKESHMKNSSEQRNKSYTYNAFGQLLKVMTTQITADHILEDEYTYDHFGRRQSKNSNGVKKYYLYGGDTNPIAELDSYGAPTSFHVYAGGYRLAAIHSDKTLFYHSDLNGNTRLITDNNGNILQRAHFDGHGSPSYKWEVVDNNFLFAGKELDSQTGFIYVGSDYYDPNARRLLGSGRKITNSTSSFAELNIMDDFSLLNSNWSEENSGSMISIKKLAWIGSRSGPTPNLFEEYQQWLRKYEGKKWYYWKRWLIPVSGNPLNKIIRKEKVGPKYRGIPIKIPYRNRHGWGVRNISWQVGSWEVQPQLIISLEEVFSKDFWVSLKNETATAYHFVARHGFGQGPTYRQLDYTAPGFGYLAVISTLNNIVPSNLAAYEHLPNYFQYYQSNSLDTVQALLNYNIIPGAENIFDLNNNIGIIKKIKSPIYQFGISNSLTGNAGVFSRELYNNN